MAPKQGGDGGDLGGRAADAVSAGDEEGMPALAGCREQRVGLRDRGVGCRRSRSHR